MKRNKLYKVIFLSFLLVGFSTGLTPAKTSKRVKAKAHTYAQAKGKKSKKQPVEPSPLALGLDSIFTKMKQELDLIASSPLLHGSSVSLVNSYFIKILKGNQSFYSLTRVNYSGKVINEMIRLAENDDEKKRNLLKEAWVMQMVKKRAEYFSLIKLKETGRYYLVWAVPIVKSSQKGMGNFEGGLALKIDLWDCFHIFAKNIETPFLIRINRLHLYSNKWKNTIKYNEEALNVPGIKKIFVRYPKTVSTFVTTEAPAPTSAPAVSAPPAAPVIDSAQIKAAQDSQEVLLKEKDKKEKTKKALFIAGLILLIIIVGIFIFIVIPGIKQRMIMRKIDKEDDL